MSLSNRGLKVAAGFLSVALAASILSGCSQTSEAQPNVVERAQGETAPPPPPPSGFLGADYALLKPKSQDPNAPSIIGGQQQQAALAYVAPGVNFSQYNKVIIAPVTYWADPNSTLPTDQQQVLCNYFYNVLVQAFSKNYAIVSDPGPGTVTLAVALTDATAATPGLRTVSVVVPQAHALNIIKMGLTGTYAFVGSATGEAKVTDSTTGQLLAAWADQQFGTAAVKNATVWQWGDAENAMNYWANGLDQRFVTLGVGITPGGTPSMGS
jgi:Protein of unknown function (DUF3313)